MSTERYTFFSSPFFSFTQTHYAVPKKKKKEGNEKKMDQLKPQGKITFKGNLAEN